MAISIIVLVRPGVLDSCSPSIMACRVLALQDPTDQPDNSSSLLATEAHDDFDHNSMIITSETQRLMRMWSETLSTTNEDEERGIKESSGTTPTATAFIS